MIISSTMDLAEEAELVPADLVDEGQAGVDRVEDEEELDEL